MTVSARRVAAGLCGAGAVALGVSLFLNWTDFPQPGPQENAWDVLSGFDVLMAACATLGAVAALVPRLRVPAAAVAVGTLVTVVLKLHGDQLGAMVGAAPGPRVALAALLAIAAGGVLGSPRLRPAALLGVGAVALLVSTFGAWYVAGIQGAYFNRNIGAPAFVLVGNLPNAWQSFRFVDLALTVAMAVALVAILAVVRGRRDAARMGALAAAVAALALALVVWRAIDPAGWRQDRQRTGSRRCVAGDDRRGRRPGRPLGYSGPITLTSRPIARASRSAWRRAAQTATAAPSPRVWVSSWTSPLSVTTATFSTARSRERSRCSASRMIAANSDSSRSSSLRASLPSSDASGSPLRW